MPASILRRFHATLLNYALLSLPFYLGSLAIGFGNGPGPLPALGALTVASIGLRAAGLSPGHWILSVGSDGLVEDEMLSEENWLTLLIGFVLIQWGSSATLLWTRLGNVPLFGVMPDPAFAAAVCTSWGLLTILAGVLFYKLSPVGLWLGLGIVVVNAVDLFVSRVRWIDVYLTKFFEAQPPGSPFAGGTFVPEGVSYELTPWIAATLGIGSALAVLAMLLASRRLTRVG